MRRKVCSSSLLRPLAALQEKQLGSLVQLLYLKYMELAGSLSFSRKLERLEMMMKGYVLQVSTL